MAVDARTRLIVALDTPTVAQAERIVDILGSDISFYKIGLQLQLAAGLASFVRRLKRRRKRIFLDFKYYDIVETVGGVVRAAAALDIDFLTVYAAESIVRAAAEARRDGAPKILAVTLLTSFDQAAMRQQYGTDRTVEEFVVERAGLVERWGGDGVISSPNEVAAIRRHLPRPGFLVVTPGIRPGWSTADDHRRPGTPYQAIAGGADYLVVGRPIVRAKEGEIAAAASRIVEEMERGFRDRDR